MKKTCLFIAVFLLVGSIIHTDKLFAQVNDQKSEKNLVLASFTLVKSLPKVPEKMMVYKTLAPSITREDVMTLVKVFKLEGEIDDRGKQYMVSDNDKMLEVYKQAGTGYLRFSDDAKLGIEKEAKNLPSEDTAIARAKAFLQSQGLLPENTFFNRVGYYQFKKFSHKGEVILQGKSAIAVGFGFTIGDYRVEGPGAKAGVVFGENGEIIGASKIWREIKEDKEKNIITPEEAFKIFKKKWPNEAEPGQLKNAKIRTQVIVKEAYLAYYAEPGLEVQEYIKPVYMFKGEFKVTRDVGGKVFDERDYFVFTVPAIPKDKT